MLLLACSQLLQEEVYILLIKDSIFKDPFSTGGFLGGVVFLAFFGFLVFFLIYQIKTTNLEHFDSIESKFQVKQ